MFNYIVALHACWCIHVLFDVIAAAINALFAMSQTRVLFLHLIKLFFDESHNLFVLRWIVVQQRHTTCTCSHMETHRGAASTGIVL